MKRSHRCLGGLVLWLWGVLFCHSPVWAQAEAKSLSIQFKLDNPGDAWSALKDFFKLYPLGDLADPIRYEMANIFFERGSYYQAVEILLNLSREASLTPYLQASVLLRLGECYFNAGLFDEAYAVFSQLRQSPEDFVIPEAVYGMALSSLGLNENDRAQNLWEEMVKLAPNYQELQDTAFGQGLIFFRGEKFLKAREFFDRYPNDPRNLFFSALVRRSSGDPAGALMSFQNIIKKFDKTEWAERASFEMAETYYQSGDFSLALDGFRSWLLAYPGKPLWVDATFRVACAEFQNKNYDKVIRLLEPLANEREGRRLSASARHILAESYVQVDRLDDVVNLYVRRGPPEKRMPEENYGLVWVLVDKGEYEKAIQLAETSLKLFYDPELTPKLLLVEGYAHEKLGHITEAVASFQLVVDRFPSTEVAARALLMMALAYHSVGDYKSVVTLVNRQWQALPPGVRYNVRDTEFWIAEAYMNLQNYREAKLGYEKFTAEGLENPLAPYAYFGLATAQSQTGDFAQARATLKGFEQLAAEKKPELVELATLQLGHLYFNGKSYDQAVSTYKEFVTKYPRSPKIPDVMFQEATALYRGEYYSEAAKTWRELFAKHPKHPLAVQALFQSGKTEFDTGHYAEAVKDYRQLIDRYPESSLAKDARLQVGYSFYNAGDYASAVAAFNDFLKKYPMDDRGPSVQSSIQTSYFRMKKTPEEIEKLTVGQVKSGVLADMYWENGAKAYNAKDYAKAQEYFEKILLDFPSSSVAPRAFFYRAESLYSLGRLQEAARAYKTFVENYPQDEQAPMAMFRLGVSLFDMKSYPDAADAFENFAKTYPNDPTAKNAAFNVPLCYLKSNQWDKSITAYKDLLGRFGDDASKATIWYQIGTINQKLGQDADAAQAFQQVPRGSIEFPEALYYAGLSYERLQDGAGEKKVYESFIPLEPKENPYRISGLMRLAEIEEVNGDKAWALSLYQDVASHSRDSSVVAIAQKKIQELGGK